MEFAAHLAHVAKNLHVCIIAAVVMTCRTKSKDLDDCAVRELQEVAMQFASA